ncbi:DEAD/DEAH box helicase [Sneathiella sp. P13V-1]|uniref:DEAD/DEAH box helicase n=1 Tax=Sneathiella sp. P13V-1 TaxID=2697366 RepID=UPI00187B7A1D|nr:DEAD/DEAH box helicase [Sneathiella sp. P13V-1]MBE7637767.1 DEAD/DEAH box helicase [Sneathiella sp. P13V-1]
MIKFTDLALDEALLRAIDAEGYTNPTPIQTDVIPVMIAGNDVLGIAQTGTGKTASFVLPLLQKILRDGKIAKPKTCQALIMAPTRELAAQIAKNIVDYAKFTKISVAVVVGGVKPKQQIRALAAGVDILVATPGRLLDHVAAGVISLKQTNSVVLDEADQMLDLGFMPTIRKIMRQLPQQRQSVMMSATMPREIRKLATDFQTDPVEIAVAAVSKPIDRIEQSVQHVPTAEKRATLTKLLNGQARSIVFTRTKRGADKVTRHLEGAGLSAAAIHGNKSQSQRERALASFRTGQIAVLVATDIAARGIDVDDVSLVINYELPNVPESYVHRIGRTARAGRTGQAISLCDAAELDLLKGIEKLIGTRLESHSQPLIEVVKIAEMPIKTSSNSRKFKKTEGQDGAKHRRRKFKSTVRKSSRTNNKASSSTDPMAGLNHMLANAGSRKRNKPLSSGKR